MSGMTSLEFIHYTMDLSYERIPKLESYRELLGSILNEDDLNKVRDFLFKSPCSGLEYFNTVEDCLNFNDGLPKHGLALMISGYLKDVRLILDDCERKINGILSVEACLNYNLAYQVRNIFIIHRHYY